MNEIAHDHAAGGEIVDRDAVEIGEIYEGSRSSIVESVRGLIECGQRLIAKKAQLPRGAWLPWLADNADVLGFNINSTPQRLMKLARENSALAQNLEEPAEALRISREIWGHEQSGTEKNGDSCSPDDWTPDQAARRRIVEKGRSVVASMRKGDDDQPVDRALLEWAEAEGRLVRIDRQSEWGNPFLLDQDGDREAVIENYRWYLDRKPSLKAKLPELRGKVLSCWCHPEPCHGDILCEAIR